MYPHPAESRKQWSLRKPARKGKKWRLKILKLKRETVRDLSGREKKKVKGGGGIPGGLVTESRVVQLVCSKLTGVELSRP